jgi:hypothetical protein
MSEWAFHAVQLTTGSVQMDLDLVDVTAEVSLVGGAFSASVPMFDYRYSVFQRQQILAATTPGKSSIVAVRNGIVMGEWVIWNRARQNDQGPMQLSGQEIVSFAEARVTQAKTWTNTEQLTIARDLLVSAFAGNSGGAVALTVPAITPSGQLRDRTYKLGDGTMGQRLKELSEVDNGFDYIITPTWAVSGPSSILRTARFYYPRAGANLSQAFDMAGPGYDSAGSGSVLEFGVADDGSNLASRSYAIGDTVNGDVPIIGTYTDTALVSAGYPFMDTSASFTSVSTQAGINAHAKALWTDAQRTMQPVGLRVLADALPTVGDYALGDTVTVLLDVSPNFPNGYQGKTRIIGWTFNPPASGPEVITLSVVPE